MNNFNKASRYVYLLLLVELTILALIFMMVNYLFNSWDENLALILIFALEITGNLLFILAMVKLYQLFPKDFIKTIFCAVFIILISIAVFIFDKQLENNETIMLIIELLATIARMLCYYFMLSSFYDICVDMKNIPMARQVHVCRTLYMVGIILNAATNNNFAGEQLSYIFMVVYQVVSLYILFIYYRLAKTLKDYQEPQDAEPEQKGIE